MLISFLSEKLVKAIIISESLPLKGKPLLSSNKNIWILKIVLMNNTELTLISTRGTQREWASLDRLSEWIRSLGITNYQVIQSAESK